MINDVFLLKMCRKLLTVKWLWIFCCVWFVVSCGDDEKTKDETYNPKIRVTLGSFYPDSGRIAEKMLIDGNNFGTDIQIIKVYVGAKRASVISSTGKRIYVLCPKIPSRDREEHAVSVVIGKDSVVFDHKFRYKISISVSTVVGNGTATYRAGNLAEATLAPSFLCVDDEDNIFVSIRESERGLARINEMENNMTTLILHPSSAGIIIPDALCTDLNTGIIYIPCETATAVFFTCDPKEGWAPRKRSFTWRNLNGYGLPVNVWKHSFGFCKLDGYIYTRFFDGQIVKIHPKSFEADIIAMTPNGTSCGVTFHPLRPELLYIAGRTMGVEGGIYTMDVSSPNPEQSLRRLNATGSGFRDGELSTALFRDPWQIYFDPDGNLYIADTGNHCIRRIRSDNIVETVVGMPGTSGWKDGGKDDALFNSPRGVGVSKDGTVYVADYGGCRVRKLAVE